MAVDQESQTLADYTTMLRLQAAQQQAQWKHEQRVSHMAKVHEKAQDQRQLASQQADLAAQQKQDADSAAAATVSNGLTQTTGGALKTLNLGLPAAAAKSPVTQTTPLIGMPGFTASPGSTTANAALPALPTNTGAPAVASAPAPQTPFLSSLFPQVNATGLPTTLAPGAMTAPASHPLGLNPSRPASSQGPMKLRMT